MGYREPWISLSARAICGLIFDFKGFDLFGQLSKRVTRCSTMDNIYKQESDPCYQYKLKKSQVGILPFFQPNDWKMTILLLGNTLARSGDLMASFTRSPPMFTRQCERASGILHPCGSLRSRDKGICQRIPISNSLREETGLINISASWWGLKCQRMMTPGTHVWGNNVICGYTGCTF